MGRLRRAGHQPEHQCAGRSPGRDVVRIGAARIELGLPGVIRCPTGRGRFRAALAFRRAGRFGRACRLESACRLGRADTAGKHPAALLQAEKEPEGLQAGVRHRQGPEATWQKDVVIS
jgi:hypothetical protein